MSLGPILCALLQLYVIVLIVRMILSWVPSLPEPLLPIARGVSAITDPILEPMRRVLPPLRLGGFAIDLSFIVLYFLILFVLSPLLCSL